MNPKQIAKKKHGTPRRDVTVSADGMSARADLKDFVYETRSTPVRYKGVSTDSELSAWWPKKGDNAVVKADEALKHDKIYQALRDYVDTVSSAASIRKFRESLNLTQKQAGELLGGGPNAFQKYESGEVELSRPMFNLLRLLANYPERLKELHLTENRLPPPIPKKAKARNRNFNLWKRKGFADLDLVLIAAEGLRTHITLIELKRKQKGRDWSFISQQIGVKHKGKMVYRTGPLDQKPVEVLVNTALKQHGLDPKTAKWKDILASVDG